MARVFLHVGLPRTATTALQGSVFPVQDRFHYLGKSADNSLLRGHVKTQEVLESAIRSHRAGDPDGLPTLRKLLSTMLASLKIVSSSAPPREVRRSLILWKSLWQVLEDALADKPLLYSDESLCESPNGVLGGDRSGFDGVVMELLADVGWLQQVATTVVTRAPLAFLTASFYKALELRLAIRLPPVAFDDYIRTQIVLYERKPSASRIFLAQRDKITAHLQSLCPRARSVRYEDLAKAPHVLDTLVGFETGTPSVSLATEGRNNKSWRYEKVNRFLLSAPGVPAGMDLARYRETFPETLQSHGLGFLLREGA